MKSPNTNPHHKPHRVVALAYDGLCTFEYGCVVELFALPRPDIATHWYDFLTCSLEPGYLRAAGGLSFYTEHSLDVLDTADTIIIPGWRNANEIPPESLLTKLRQAYDRGTRICSICSGVFVLAAAGILKDKTVTTHWQYVDLFNQLYPDIPLEPNALYVDQGQIITAAGSAAGLDMMLHIIRKDQGTKVANKIAQRLVMPAHREGGQAQYIARPIQKIEAGRLAKLLDWIRAHIAEPHCIESLANRMAVSERTLHRQFMAVTGLSPYDWLLRERIVYTKELLENTAMTLSSIVEKTGFTSESSLRKHFRNQTGVSLGHYRKQFFAINE